MKLPSAGGSYMDWKSAAFVFLVLMILVFLIFGSVALFSDEQKDPTGSTDLPERKMQLEFKEGSDD